MSMDDVLARLRGYNKNEMDPDTNPLGMDGLGYIDNFPQALRDVASVLDSTVRITTPSSTSVTIATGQHTFELDDPRVLPVGAEAVAIDDTAPGKARMWGTIAAADASTSPPTLTLDVSVVEGSGTSSSWTLALSGRQARDLTHRGAWSSATSYRPLDVVTHDPDGGGLRAWVANGQTTDSEPGPTNSDWSVIGSVQRSFSDWITKTSAYTASKNDRILADTSGGAFTITLPSGPSVGAQVFFADAFRTWDTNNLTVDGHGNNILGATTFIADVKDWAFSLVYNGTQWVFGGRP